MEPKIIFETSTAIVKIVSPTAIAIEEKGGPTKLSLDLERKIEVKVWGVNSKDVKFRDFSEDQDFPPAFSFEI